jgi:hypothetical protein
MKNLRNSLKASGYDSEEAYFYAREQELIQKLRASSSQTPTQPKLELLPGGRVDSKTTPVLQNKKAA